MIDGAVPFLIRDIAAIFTIRILNVPAILCGAFFVLRIILRAVLLRAVLSVTVLSLIIVFRLLFALTAIMAIIVTVLVTTREAAAAGVSHFAFRSFLLLGRELFVDSLIAFGNADSGQLFDGA